MAGVGLGGDAAEVVFGEVGKAIAIRVEGLPSGARFSRGLNNGDRTFTDVTDVAGVRDGDWGWGANFFDYDNDGLPDALDLDSDGDVDVFDFGIFGPNFGTGSGATREDGDLDCDGDIDVCNDAGCNGFGPFQSAFVTSISSPSIVPTIRPA